MKRIIQILVPNDPPFTPMAFTRMPIVHRFWYGGLGAATVGFTLGFWLWMWQHGFFIHAGGDYFLFKLWHARIQIEGFVGSFLLGFALQSGPHMTGGKPPPSNRLLILFNLLWLGLALSFIPNSWLAMLGSGLVSMAYGGAGYFLFRVTLAGNPQLLFSRGLPLASGITLMALAPWLELDEPALALFILWCGPVTMALVAAQQLINNVLGGQILQNKIAYWFAFSLLLAWIATGIAAFTSWGTWQTAGIFWLGTLILLIKGTNFIQVAWRFGWASINVTLILGFIYAFGCGVILLDHKVPLDVTVHLLGAALLTTLIIGVTARVVGFFSAGAVLPDRMVSYFLVLWGMVALTRTVSPLLPMEEIWTVYISVLGGLLLMVWGIRTGYRLKQIHKLLPATITKK